MGGRKGRREGGREGGRERREEGRGEGEKEGGREGEKGEAGREGGGERGFRKISHSLNFFSLYDGEKECRGYTLFPHLITMGKKSVGYTFKFPPY